MSVKQEETPWKKHMSIIRDVVFIVLFLASIVGWIRSEIKNNEETLIYNTEFKTEIKQQIGTLNDKIIDLTKQIELQNKVLNEQLILNGKIIQFMETNKNR